MQDGVAILQALGARRQTPELQALGPRRQTPELQALGARRQAKARRSAPHYTAWRLEASA